MPSKNVCVVVLGDIGRSPRMQYHSLSLAEHGHKVDIVGYGETQPFENLKLTPSISYHYLVPYPNLRISRLLNYAVKTIWQSLTLLFTLFIIRRPDIILVQNPPAVPTLVICWLFKCLVRAKLIIDWHNYAHTIMALSVGKNNSLVQVTKKLESIIGKKADGSFCVTNAMKNDLLNNWNISAITLYDKPPEKFKPISVEAKHEFWSCLSLKYNELISADGLGTVFTQLDGDVPKLRPDRPGILISSTSWTEDEDFSLLLAALQEYEEQCVNGNPRSLPKLICFITGKGPLKQHYCDKISEQKWQHVHVITPWLEDKDYPLLLSSADLGVCLHISSSGLDLPMKVVDMFGCGLPVCAYEFECLNELVKDGINSYTFKTTQDLSQQIQNWFEHFPNNEKQKELENKFKTELKTFQTLRWKENWNNIAAPVFN